MKRSYIPAVLVLFSMIIIVISQWIKLRPYLLELKLVEGEGSDDDFEVIENLRINAEEINYEMKQQNGIDIQNEGIDDNHKQENFSVNFNAIANIEDELNEKKKSFVGMKDTSINLIENESLLKANETIAYQKNAKQTQSDSAKDHKINKMQNENLNTTLPPPTDWRKHFYSQNCMKHRMAPVGRMRYGTVGQGQRAKCADINSSEESEKEIFGSVDVSLSHKAIYIPVMKAGTQMFKEVFRQRFNGKRIEDDKLQQYIGRKTNINTFFVFTFVREPFSIFRSAYGEVSRYAANARVRDIGFARFNQSSENEPTRAIESLRDVAHGVFTGLVPAHMHTQLWKINRCFGKLRRNLPIHFIGHVENIESDWREVENRLNVPHEPLPVIHASAVSNEHLYAKKHLRFDPVPEKGKPGSRFSPLTAKVCEYYSSDFDCFGYDKSLCGK